MTDRDDWLFSHYRQPQVRPRTTILAVTLLVAIACLLGSCISRGAMRTITIEGTFTQQRNIGHFGLALPIPFTFSCGYDDASPNTGTSTVGIYETEGAYCTLSFAGYNFWTQNTEVRVYADPQGVREAIGFGNEDGWAQYGLLIQPYRAYAFFDNLFWVTPGWNNSLDQVRLREGDPHFQTISYVYIEGLDFYGTETLLQTGSAISYHVQ